MLAAVRRPNQRSSSTRASVSITRRPERFALSSCVAPTLVVNPAGRSRRKSPRPSARRRSGSPAKSTQPPPPAGSGEPAAGAGDLERAAAEGQGRAEAPADVRVVGVGVVGDEAVAALRAHEAAHLAGDRRLQLDVADAVGVARAEVRVDGAAVERL